MSSIKQRLEDLKNKSDKLLDAQSLAINKKVRVYLTNALGRITGILADFDKSGTFAVADAESLIRDVETTIVREGLPNLLSDFNDSFVKIGADALSYFAKIQEDGSFGGVDKQILNILTRDRVRQFDQIIQNDLVNPIRSKIIEGTIGKKDRSLVTGEITDFIRSENLLRKDGRQFLNNNIEVLVGDSHRAFHAIVREEKAQEIGLDARLYQGPEDSLTRKACKAMLNATPHDVPGLYLEEEVTIDFMNEIITAEYPGAKDYELLSADPIVGRGGWNCRHEFYPISGEFARELGFKE